MCTLTVVPTPAGYRAAFNRDERPDRPAALPPCRQRSNGVGFVAPTDPVSGGTWLAVSDRGLTFALLNGNPGRPTPPGRGSRGTIIPLVAGAADPVEAVDRAAGLSLADFAPFRFVVVAGGVATALLWDGTPVRDLIRLDRPVLFTSSGLGDAVVTAPREALFAELLAAGDAVAAQDAFHRHRWPGRGHLSVNMHRPGARTVSHAVIDVTADAANVRYHAAAPDEPGVDAVLELPLAAGGTA